ncbi:MAG: hypothetical protein F4Z25_01695 [Chloroflexi bacterium]|nr:hypothetical protein [Chloroflexota bacterium]
MTAQHSADQPAPDEAPATLADAAAAPSDAEAQQGDLFALDLPKFHGPLELLLHLIERRELDITEVSLVAVTEQYLAHVREGDHIDLGALASFIAMGARLLLLKSRALLPRDPEDEDEAEDSDPQALLDALAEYRRYRQAAEHLRDLESEHRTGYRREAAAPELPLPSGLDGVTTDQLYALFREVLERLPEEEPQTEVEREAVVLRDRVSLLTERLERDRTVSFRELIGAATSRLVVIVDFLAVLELIRRRYVEARQDDAFGEITLARIEGASPPSLPSTTELSDT